MYAAENAYLSMEAGTQHILDNISSYYPGYDEYNVSAESIGHDPYILISILSALHEGVFTIGDVQSELDTLFELQYELTVEAITETRYRTETRVGSYTYTGHAEIDMITSVYAHILDEDRKVNAQKFETAFYSNPDLRDVRPPAEPKEPAPATLDLASLVEQLQKSPELASALAALIAAQAPASGR